MSPIDVVGDTGGFLSGIVAGLGSLNTVLVSLSALVEVMIVCMCVLVAVEVARGVMRR